MLRGELAATEAAEAELEPTEPSVLPETQALPIGARVGRYVVLQKLGEGGMGAAYAAFDPVLDRKIALKVLHRAADAGATPAFGSGTWLLRESQALARLAHPNVVAIHDVGSFGSRVFMAMELVEGQTLAAWLGSRARSPRQVLEAFLAAGRGLEAAHAKRLVHHDFKPTNVLVGTDGRVRVTDFGLARPADASAGGPPSLAPGTPSAAAPEQLRGETTDARSDQFSFCLALYRALWGRHPFLEPSQGSSAAEYAAAMQRAAKEPPRTRVSGAVRRAILRGLALDPRDRHASMGALLEVLARAPTLTGGRVALGVGAALLIATSTALWARANRGKDAECTGADQHLAGVWDEGVRARARQAFDATHLPYATNVFASVARTLDGFRDAWLEAHVDNCRATQVRKTQTLREMDLRGACLFRKLQEARAVSSLIAAADAKVVERAVTVVEALGGMGECADVSALARGDALPADPAVRARIDTVRASLAKASALKNAAKYEAAIAEARAAREQALKLDSATLRAESVFLLSAVFGAAGRPREADIALADTLREAERSRSDRLRAEVLVFRSRIAGWEQHSFASAADWALLANAAIERVDDDLLRAKLARIDGSRHFAEGSPRQSIARGRRGVDLALRPGTRVAPSELWTYFNTLGIGLMAAGEHAEANRTLQKALELVRRTYGPEHPLATFPLHNLGEQQLFEGRFERCIESFTEVLRVLSASRGPEHPSLALPSLRLGQCLSHVGQFRDARAAIERALSLWRSTQAPRALDRSLGAYALGELAALQGHWAEAERHHREALRLGMEDSGPSAFWLATSHDALGRVLSGRGDFHRALEEHQRSLAITLRAIGVQNVLVLESLAGQAEALAGLRRFREAKPLAEQALGLAEQGTANSAVVARVRLCLARALVANGADGTHGAATERARALVRQALTAVGGDSWEGRLVAELEAFLRGN